MYIPKGYTAKKKWPLVISAPGTFPFDSPPGTRNAWVDAAEQHGLIDLLPRLRLGQRAAEHQGRPEETGGRRQGGDGHRPGSARATRIDPNGIFTTGWSGGGYPAHYIGLKHPDMLRAIIGRTANFSEDLVDDETARKARHMHVFCFFAESDLAGIPEQNRRANFYYTTRGFLNFEIKEVPGGHSKNNDLAGEWISKLLNTWPTAKSRPRRSPARPADG